MKRLLLMVIVLLSIVVATIPISCSRVVEDATYIETLDTVYVDRTEATVFGKLLKLDVTSLVYYGFVGGTTKECTDFQLGPVAIYQPASFQDTAYNLQPNTKYYYRAFVEYPVRIYYGEIKSFTTKP